MSQPDKNMFSHDKNYKDGYLTCAILKKNGDEYQHLEGFANKSRDPWGRQQLQAGSYIAILYTNWESTNRTYTLWAYGVNKVKFYKVEAQDAYKQSVEWLAQAVLRNQLQQMNTWKILGEGVFKNAFSKFS